MPPPGGGGKRGRDTKVSLPLLTPRPFLRTRLPSVARLKARGPQIRLVLQGYTLDRSGAFRSGTPPPCTGWPRTVMRGKPRKENSGPNSVPKSARRTEPSPVPTFSRATAGSRGAKEGLGESRGGKGTIRCPCPLLPLAVGTAPPAGEHRHLRRQTAALPRRRRRPLRTLTLSINPPPAARRFIRSRNSRFSYKTNRLSPSSMVYYS